MSNAATVSSGASERRFRAFVSYSHVDQKSGARLARDLERYRLPRSLVGSRNRHGEVLGRRLGLVFRDREELGASTRLKADIARALELSDNLIVICSPNAARSAYVGEEIRYFKKLGREHRIFALIVDGEPNAASRGRPELECFPPALLQNAAGQPSPDEPIAADARKIGDGWHGARTKLTAGLLAIDLDRLRQRQRRRFIERCAIATVVSIAVLGVVLYFADRARRADEQSRLQALQTQAQQALGEIRQGRTTAGLQQALSVHQQLVAKGAPLFPALVQAIGQGLLEQRERKIVRRRNYYHQCIDGNWQAFTLLLDGKTLKSPYIQGSTACPHFSHDLSKRAFIRPDTHRVVVVQGRQQPAREFAAEKVVVSVTLDGHGDRMAFTSLDGELRIIDLERAPSNRLVSLGERVFPGAIAMSNNGRLVGVGTEGGSLVIVDAERGQVLAKLGAGPGRVEHVAFGADDHLVAAADDEEIRLWWTDDLSRFGRLVGHAGKVLAIAFSPDGHNLASLGRDDTTRLWDLGAGEPAIAADPGIARRPVARGVLWPSLRDGLVSSDKRLLLRAEGKTARLIERASGRELHAWTDHEQTVTALALSADGTLAATGAADGGARVWSTETGALLRLVPFEDKVTSVSFDHAGELLLAASDDGTARIIEVVTGKERATIEARVGISWADFAAADGLIVLVAHDVLLADATTGRIVPELARDGDADQAGPSPSITAAAAADEVLALGRSNGILELWDLPTRQRLAQIELGKIEGLDVSNDLRTLEALLPDKPPLAWPIAGRFADMVERAQMRLPEQIDAGVE